MTSLVLLCVLSSIELFLHIPYMYLVFQSISEIQKKIQIILPFMKIILLYAMRLIMSFETRP